MRFLCLLGRLLVYSSALSPMFLAVKQYQPSLNTIFRQNCKVLVYSRCKCANSPKLKANRQFLIFQVGTCIYQKTRGLRLCSPRSPSLFPIPDMMAKVSGINIRIALPSPERFTIQCISLDDIQSWASATLTMPLSTFWELAVPATLAIKSVPCFDTI